MVTEVQKEFQSLRERLVQLGKPIVIVGGICKRQKLQLVAERFGLEVEWHEIDSDSQRDTDVIVRRIKGGSVAAVILLMGLMAHRVSKKVIDACQSCNIPYTTGDRAGTGSLETALSDLERKLA